MSGFQVDQDGYYAEVRVGSRLDFGIEWEDWIGSDTIASSVWNIPSPLVKESESNDLNTAVVVISGFVLGETYEIENTITTAGPPSLIDSRSFRLVCVAD